MSGRAPLRPTAEAAAGEDHEVERMRRELGEMRRELRQAHREISDLRELMSAARPEAHGATSAPDLAELGTEPSQAPTLEPIDGFADDAARFEGEPPDRAWDPSPQLHRDLSAVLPQGSAIRSLECRSSLCRLETTHRDLPRYDAFTRHFTFFAGEAQVWNTGATFQVTHEPEHEGDELRAVAYLHRGPTASDP